MEIVKEFFIHNFVLLCLSLVMITNAIMHYSQSKRISIFSIIITASCLLLAVSVTVQNYAKEHSLYYLALTFAILGYVLRPLCLYFFIMMNKKAYRGKWSFLIWIPLVVNVIVYLLAYIPGTESLIFGFHITEDGLSFWPGTLRFTSHIISIGYLIYLIYISIFTLKTKHIMHGVTILTCAAFVTAAVIIETFFSDGSVEILNATIMVSTLSYYLFLYKENMQIDGLTGLFNRDTYYRDLPRMNRSVTGIIQYDINGLKYINDHQGHLKGDKAISTIASIIDATIDKGMYAYRLGGDEFLVIVNGSSEERIVEIIKDFKEKLSKTKYNCSVGYAFSVEKKMTVEELTKIAEKNMYLDKNEFYSNSSFERRKS